MNIDLIKNESEIPSQINPNGIVMNGMDYPIQLGFTKSFTGIFTGNSLNELKQIADNCDHVGALLSYNGETYTIWNGDSDASDYWNPHEYYDENGRMPSTQYGNIIAVCAGKGLWPIVNWYGQEIDDISITIQGSSTTMKQGLMCWASNGSDLYNTYLSKLSREYGWENTKYIFEHFGSEVKSWNHNKIEDGDSFSSWTDYNAALTPLWEQLTKSQIDGIKDWELNNDGSVKTYGDLFIPNDTELKTIIRNCFDNNQEGNSGDTEDIEEDSMYYTYYHNIGKLLRLSSDYYYWSSSQGPDYNDAFFVDGGNGYVVGDNKGYDYLSLACLHF